MKKDTASSFDELVRSYYGQAEAGGIDNLTLEDLFANYYGSFARLGEGKKKQHNKKPAVVLSLSYDDGRTLAQRRGKAKKQARGYARQQSVGKQPEEYVVGCGCNYSKASSASETVVDAIPAEEYIVDVLHPLEDSPVTSPPAPKPNGHQQDAAQPPTVQHAPPAIPPANAAPPAPTPEQATPRAAPVAPPAPTTPPQQAAEEDEFMADMKAIMSGQSVYDPQSKKTLPKAQAPEQRRDAPSPPPGDPNSSQAIFDRIAQSMQYANAYDLGTMELTNRFADFDRSADEEQKDAARKKAARQYKAQNGGAQVPPIDTADFIRDLDAIRQRATETFAPPAYGSAMSTGQYSYPLYDTGEHVLAGGDLYPNALRVGQPPGVLFSYGEIIAMADLFASPEDMMSANTAQLNQIKQLINKSVQYYQSGKKSPDVTTKEWQDATNKQYLRLAQDNYEHFSPDYLFQSAGFNKAPTKFGNNKAAWEYFHEKAIHEAQTTHREAESKKVSVVPEWALIINAFGDHFLTDAFASGHIINKEAIIRYFKSSFYDGSDLRSEAKDFFNKVAKLAFRGKLAQKFSTLETVDYPVCKWGWCIKWRPNIDSASMFGKLLIAAAEEEPDRVANFAVKALHDRLNKDGIEVTNNAGESNWRLTGDAYMTPKTLSVMRKAVKQSADNITDPSIHAANFFIGVAFASVWDHVPQLTPASHTLVTNLARVYTSPTSTTLINEAADLIYSETEALIETLLAENKLKVA